MNLTKKIRFLFRFLLAVIKTQYRLIFLGLLLGIIFSVFLPRIIKILPQSRKTLKIGLVGDYTLNELPHQILQDISYGLTKINQKGEATFAISEEWNVSSDGKTYRFKIKNNNEIWHDGKPFKLTDINYNFKDVDIKIEGDQIVFNLNEPFSPFPTILAKPLFKKGLIGLGEYQVKRLEKKGNFVKSILLTPTKFKKDNQNLPNKLYRFYNNEKDLKTAFNLGEINIIENLFDLNGLQLGPSVEVREKLLENAYVAIFFDTSRPPFSEKSFRQALAYAIPKEKGSKRALGPLNPNSWAYNPDVKPYQQDLNHAKKLLEQEKIGKDVKIVISTFPQYESLAKIAKESWEAIGLKTEIQIVTFLPEHFDAVIIGREIPYDPDQYYFWHSKQAGNLSNFENLRIDKLLEDGRKTVSKEKREEIYFDFQRFLVEESPAIFLIHPTTYTVIRN